MKPSSAIALVSAMLGAAMPLAWEIVSFLFPQPAISVAAAAQSKAHLGNLLVCILCFSHGREQRYAKRENT
jgi:hypothetical protein